MSEHRFATWDGVELFYRAWQPDTPAQKAVLLVHRGHEHSARWQETVESLQLDDVAVFAWDQRGHGNSPGERGVAPNLAAVIKDAEAFARHVAREHGIALENTVVMAHSVGAVIAAAWVHDFAPPIRGLILGTPAFRVKLYIPFAIPALRLKQKLFGPGVVKSYVKATMVTHDPKQAMDYKADPQIFRQIAVNILLDLHDTSTRLLADAGAITVPTLLLAAGNDWVVSVDAQKKFFKSLGSRIKQIEFFPGFYHAIFHEKDRHRVVSRVKGFIDECFARPVERDTLIQADQGGYTRSEYDLLRGPGCWCWSLVRLWMKSIGMLSQGIRLGWQTGFDSGITLDYVYENQPRGTSFIGRFIDKQYLNSIGWSGIRIRRQHLERTLQQCMRQTHESGKPVRIVDVAAGPGRYVIETLKSLTEIPASAVLRDYKPANVEAARRLAEQSGVRDLQCVQADAFDRASLASMNPRPTIAIVSGLFELIPDNERVLRCLRGLGDAVEPGGHLIYTNQPWHPQVEFIARSLTNREGQPWVMRRRTQAEMDALVREAGFEKLDQEIDHWGIFTVSIARRVSG